MKKLVLIMVSALVLTIFISFNYLLWFRGQQITEYQTEIKNMEQKQSDENSIANSKIKDYMAEIVEKEKLIESLDKEIADLKGSNKELEQDSQQKTADNKSKNAVINKLKEKADLEQPMEVIRNWVDFIDKAKYEDAYKLQNSAPMSQDAAKSLSDFAEFYKENIKNTRVKSIELLTDGIPEDKKGDVIFKVSLDVTKAENAVTAEFADGLNEMYFTLTVDGYTNDWIISDIASDLN